MAQLIDYRDLHEVPRMFVAEHEGRQYLFDGSFNDDLDEYPDDYDVFELPRLSLAELAGSWQNISRRAVQHLGRVPVESVNFDRTRRREIDAGVLANLARRPLVA